MLSSTTSKQERNARTGSIRLETLGIAILIACLISSLIYRTYAISMPTLSLEAARQFDLIFLTIEVGIICYAIANGLVLSRYLLALDGASRIALGLFLSTFWIGGLFFSPVPSISVIHLACWLIHILFAISLFHCLQDISKSAIANFAFILAITLALTVPIIALHLAFPPNELTSLNGRFGWGVAIPGYISGRLFGAYCGAVLALLTGIILQKPVGGASSNWVYAAILLVAGLVIWSGTRAAIVGVGGAAMIGLIVTKSLPAPQVIAKLSACFVLAAIIAPQFIPYNDPYFLMFEAKDLASGNAASGGRFSLWLTATRIIADYPLFGAGDGILPLLLPANVFPHVQPHNAVLQFLLSWGLIGALPALFLLARATWYVHAVAWKQPFVAPVLMMLDALLIMSLLDGIFYFNRFLMLIFLGYAAIFAAGRSAGPTGTPQHTP